MSGPSSPAPGGAGATGDPVDVEQRSPWFVAIVGVLTFGVYFAYWLWETSQEADRFDEYGASPYDVTKWAIPTAVVGGIGTLALGTYMVVTAIGRIPENPTPEQMQEISQAMLPFAIPYMVFGLALLVGGIAMIVAEWRLWKFIERHEEAAGVRDALSPGLMLGVLVGGYLATLIPFLGFLILVVASGYVLHRTQSGLNTIWGAARRGYDPRSAWPHPGQAQPTPPGDEQRGGTTASSEDRSDDGETTFSPPGGE